MAFQIHQPHNLAALPPQIDPKDLNDPNLFELRIKARAAMAELKGTCRAIVNPNILLAIPLLQESVASSEIEGIHTTVQTALENQVKASAEQDPASKEALNYRDAVLAGQKSLKEYSLSTRTILAIHEDLMPNGGGQFRQQQNQIAKGKKTIIYTPPAAPQVASLINNWENYIHTDDGLDPLIRVAICHYQFEAIHPFSDGNGRTGRILMVLQLVLSEMLEHPILYISGYLNQNRDEYYRLLNDVTQKGSWIEYIRFMLTALYEQAKTTQIVVEKLLDERARLKNRIRDDFPQIYSPDLLDHLFSYAVTYPTFMANKLNITYQTASKYLSMLEGAGILEKKKSGRNNLYTNPKIMECLIT